MGETPTVFDVTDDQAEADAIAEAEADVAAGRTVPHETVVRWLRTIGQRSVSPARSWA